MSRTAILVKNLWETGEVDIPSDHGKQYRAVFTRPAQFFDLVIVNDVEPMGFVTLKYNGGGEYSIVNDTAVNSHHTFLNTPGHGIEVKAKFRKRGIGGALLSLGIGIVQADWRLLGEDGEFHVVASDITDLGMGCYQNFGFEIKEGMRVSAGYYVRPDVVPEVRILPRRAAFWTRFRKRLRLG